MAHFRADFVGLDAQGHETVQSSHLLAADTVFEAQREALAIRSASSMPLAAGADAVFILAGKARLRGYRKSGVGESGRWGRA